MAAALSQTKASSVPLRVARNEVNPSKVTEHEASQIKASTAPPLRVTETEVDSSVVKDLEDCHTEVSPSLPLGVAQAEVEPSKVMEHEASQMEVEPSEVIDDEACMPQACPPSVPLEVAEMEVEPSETMDREASLYDALLAANWEPRTQLRRICVLGNSFRRYAVQAEENRSGPAAKAKLVLEAERFAREERVDEAGDVDEEDGFACAINETSWHFFEVDDHVEEEEGDKF